MEAARQCVQHALNCAAQAFADQDGSKNLAVLFQADPLSAETEFKDCFLQMGCTMLSGAFESFDHGPSVEVEGRKYTKAAPTTGQAMTTLGRVKFKRPRYRRTDRQGESFIPAEHQLGLTEGNQTSAAAGLSMALLSSLPARESADFWKRFVGDGPSTRHSGAIVRRDRTVSGRVFDRSYGRAPCARLTGGVQLGESPGRKRG